MKILIPFLKILDFAAPRVSARIAYWFLSNPQQRKLRDFEQAMLDEASPGKLNFKNFTLQTYLWNAGADRKALVIHGWEGQAGNFGAIVPVLVEQGFQVESFDAPGHGNSSRGNTAIPDYVESIQQFVQKNDYDLIITHSFGSVATIFALSNLKANIKQIILLTTPNRFEDRIQQVISFLGLTDRTRTAFIELFEERTGYDPLKMNADEMCKNIRAQKVTFIHDINDRVTPIEWSKAVHRSWGNSELIEIGNTGHFKMLWSDQTLSLIRNLIDRE